MIDTTHIAAVILAAGKGTRMCSDLAKVLHPINGIPMIRHVAQAVTDAGISKLVLVVGHQKEKVVSEVDGHFETVLYAHQDRQLGTGHAVQCALPALTDSDDHVLILCGDTPLVSRAIIEQMLSAHLKDNADISVLAVRVDQPAGYGRVVTSEAGLVTGIVEEADADEETRKITLINSGIYCVKRRVLSEALAELSCANRQNEYYLTDIVRIAAEKGLRVAAPSFRLDPFEVMGVNTIDDLERAQRYFTCTRN